MVRDVPYGTLQLVFFEFFKELPPFFSSIKFLSIVEHWKGGLRLPVNFFPYASAKFVCESQNSGDILVHQDFYTPYNKVLTLKSVDFI